MSRYLVFFNALHVHRDPTRHILFSINAFSAYYSLCIRSEKHLRFHPRQPYHHDSRHHLSTLGTRSRTTSRMPGLNVRVHVASSVSGCCCIYARAHRPGSKRRERAHDTRLCKNKHHTPCAARGAVRALSVRWKYARE